ncbi:MAG TPA: nucleotidyltransferase domain-containing protein, partial [Clostridia bacterium]|nr:nucleotidyltransferase domain-containing protein [Clostridia bacterium]
LYARMWDQFADKPAPTYENLRGTYEELWCNYRNKVLASAASGDASYALHTALGAQNFLDEMAEDRGTPCFDLLKDFDAENLAPFRDAFFRAMEEYLKEYDRVGRKVEQFETLEELMARYMGNVIP